MVSVQTKVGTSAGTYYFTYTGHLSNVMAHSGTGGAFVPGSTARYDPFGTFTTTPSTNPSITSQGFTGHRHNNTGPNDLGLIYMNTRYYLPEVGRFVSPDTLVPDPGEPQSYNRYSYVLNSPVNYVAPSEHRRPGQE
jgi:RHS repeat-associated protein